MLNTEEKTKAVIAALEDVKATIDVFKIMKQKLATGEYALSDVPFLGDAFR